MWIYMALLSSLFAGLTSIFAKCGIKKTDSDVATAIRTIVVFIFAGIMVKEFTSIDSRSLLFLILSGMATGASWLCYFKALSMADVNKVVPIDKSSGVLTIILAILFFHETNHLFIKIIGIITISMGIFMMIEKKDVVSKSEKGWFIYAIGSALFAALCSILAKIGISNIDSNYATFIRTGVVLIMAWFIVFLKHKQQEVKHIDNKELFFICISGLSTGASWLCYYYAIQNGIVSVVVPIDKLSIVVSIVFSSLVFKEKLTPKSFIGLCLMVVGTILMALFA